MTEDDASANIEWEQKKASSPKERLSRRIDVQKAVKAQAKDRNNFKSLAKQVKNLSPNIRKLKTKIKDVYDDDDEDEDEENEVIFNFNLEDGNSSLISALKEEEKASLKEKQNTENIKLQQTAGKMQAILMADQMSKKLGLKGVNKKTINTNVQDATLTFDAFDKTISQNVAQKTKINTENLSPKKTAQMIKGLKRIKKMNLTDEEKKNLIFDTMDAEDLIKIGKTADDKKTAELILEKSGRKEKKNPIKKDARDKQKLKETVRKVKVRE